MSHDEISTLIQLHAGYGATEANLWVMYTAATLACAGFGISTNTLTSFKMGVIASVGFLAFAVGQFVMAQDVILTRELIIAGLPMQDMSPQFAGLVQKIGRRGLTVPGAVLTHVVVDTCVVALIMFRPVSKWLART